LTCPDGGGPVYTLIIAGSIYSHKSLLFPGLSLALLMTMGAFMGKSTSALMALIVVLGLSPISSKTALAADGDEQKLGNLLCDFLATGNRDDLSCRKAVSNDVIRKGAGIYGVIHLVCGKYSQAARPADAAAREVQCDQVAVENMLPQNADLSKQVLQCTWGPTYFAQRDCLRDVFEARYAAEMAAKISNDNSSPNLAIQSSTHNSRSGAVIPGSSGGDAASPLITRAAE
jgi:hypothetical protein